MALNATTLANDIRPDLESKIRQYILSGDNTPYPNLTNFCQSLAESFSEKVINHIKNSAELNNAKANGATATTTNGSGGYDIVNVNVTGGIK